MIWLIMVACSSGTVTVHNESDRLPVRVAVSGAEVKTLAPGDSVEVTELPLIGGSLTGQSDVVMTVGAPPPPKLTAGASPSDVVNCGLEFGVLSVVNGTQEVQSLDLPGHRVAVSVPPGPQDQRPSLYALPAGDHTVGWAEGAPVRGTPAAISIRPCATTPARIQSTRAPAPN